MLACPESLRGRGRRPERFRDPISSTFFTTLFYFYILYSKKLDRYYIGSTENISERIKQHNSGLSKYISKATDWEIKHVESFCTRNEALKREHAIKAKKSRKYIEYLISTKE